MRGVIAEYADPRALVRAAHLLRGRHYRRLEAYTPHAVRDLDDALGRRRSRIGWAVFVAGILGAAAAYGLEWLVDAYLYPVNVGGRPAHMPLAFVPITFEMGVLAAGLCTFFGVLVLARLVKLWHPVFEAEGFTSATDDGYWLEVRANDPKFDRTETPEHLRASGALRVVAIALLLGACGGGFERMDDQSAKRCDRDRATPWLPGGACDLAPPDGTVAWHDTPAPPAPLTKALLERGRDRFDRFCAACHGLAGDGRSPVADAMTDRKPPSLHEDRIRTAPDSHVDDVIAHGFGFMPSYGDALGAADRQAVIAYLRVLEASQDEPLDQLPDDVRTEAMRWIR